MSATKLSFFLISIDIGEIPVGAHLLLFLVSYLESLLITEKVALPRKAPRTSKHNVLVQWTVIEGDTGSDFEEETDAKDIAVEPLCGNPRWMWDRWKMTRGRRQDKGVIQ